MAESKKEGKKNKSLPIIIIALLAVVAGAWFLFGRKVTKLGSPASLAKYATLKAAVEAGVPMKCSYSVNGNEYEGWVKGKMWRGKIKSTEGISEVIMKDNCMWTWSDAQPQGMKFCFEENEVDDNMWGQEDVAGITYNCAPAVVTESQFTPPSGIDFLDFDQMMQQYGQ